MANLAIKGHATRGREVIESLEMLGGKNKISSDGLKRFNGTNVDSYYTIEEDNHIHMRLGSRKGDYIKFTIEEFFEKFPYKVGDKVLMNGIPKTIKGINWDSNSNEIVYKVETNVRGFTEEYHVFAYDIQPYKEETMEDKGTLVQVDLTREICVADEVEVILGDYEFVLKDGKTCFVKKKPQYPKTYEECCKVLGLEYIGIKRNENNYSANCYKNNLICAFVELFICRDAYWKIAGEQMELGKPWEPSKDEECYCLYHYRGKIFKGKDYGESYVLEFPSAEMRDAFKENFDKDIDLCKEFL